MKDSDILDFDRATTIIIKNNNVLLFHRFKNGEEYWVFPGGSIEEGESPEDAVDREIKEELNLKIQQKRFLFKRWFCWNNGFCAFFIITEITKNKDARGFTQNKKAAQEGGEVAGNARKDAEKRIGKTIISNENYLGLKKKKQISIHLFWCRFRPPKLVKIK